MSMGVLGPLQLVSGGRNRVPSAPKPRQLLALLIINVNDMVPANDCLNELWDTRPPKSAMSTLQTYILNLRHLLDDPPGTPDAPALLTMSQGYRFAANRLELDRCRFEELVRQGGDAARAQDDTSASALYAQALRLWRGPALADVRAGPLILPALIELEERRMYVREQRIGADLRLNRHHELLDELDMLTTAHPTNENLHAQFMIALYRAGRPAQALTVFHRLRSTLDDLGFEPGTRIKRLLLAVRSAHPLLGASHSGP